MQPATISAMPRSVKKNHAGREHKTIIIPTIIMTIAIITYRLHHLTGKNTPKIIFLYHTQHTRFLTLYINCDILNLRCKMINYDPFYKTLINNNITEYQLINKHGFSSNILHRMKHGKNITLKTLDTLCFILDCDVSDIISCSKDT